MMLLQEIFGSKSKIGLLAKVIDSKESFSVRELARLGGLPKSTVSLIVDEWQKTGLLDGQTIGKTKVLRINPLFPLYPAMLNIFSENEKIMDKIISTIKKSRVLRSGDVICAIVFGSLAKKSASSQSDADILIITKEQFSEKHSLNNLWKELYQKIPLLPTPVFLTKKQVLGRLKEKDEFIANVFRHGIALKGGDWFDSTKRAFRHSIRKI